jgi:hypothetical protein
VQNPSGPEEEDPLREARAYNQSIYLMVGMPYLLLGVVGYMVYRGLRQKALAEGRAVAGQSPAAAPGDSPCPPPSPAGAL